MKLGEDSRGWWDNKLRSAGTSEVLQRGEMENWGAAFEEAAGSGAGG